MRAYDSLNLVLSMPNLVILKTTTNSWKLEREIEARLKKKRTTLPGALQALIKGSLLIREKKKGEQRPRFSSNLEKAIFEIEEEELVAHIKLKSGERIVDRQSILTLKTQKILSALMPDNKEDSAELLSDSLTLRIIVALSRRNWI